MKQSENLLSEFLHISGNELHNKRYISLNSKQENNKVTFKIHAIYIVDNYIAHNKTLRKQLLISLKVNRHQ